MSKLYICKMGRRKTPLIFENIEIIDAGARGKTVAKAPDGRVIFLTNTVLVMLLILELENKEKLILKVLL